MLSQVPVADLSHKTYIRPQVGPVLNEVEPGFDGRDSLLPTARPTRLLRGSGQTSLWGMNIRWLWNSTTWIT